MSHPRPSSQQGDLRSAGVSARGGTRPTSKQQARREWSDDEESTHTHGATSLAQLAVPNVFPSALAMPASPRGVDSLAPVSPSTCLQAMAPRPPTTASRARSPLPPPTITGGARPTSSAAAARLTTPQALASVPLHALRSASRNAHVAVSPSATQMQQHSSAANSEDSLGSSGSYPSLHPTLNPHGRSPCLAAEDEDGYRSHSSSASSLTSNTDRRSSDITPPPPQQQQQPRQSTTSRGTRGSVPQAAHIDPLAKPHSYLPAANASSPRKRPTTSDVTSATSGGLLAGGPHYHVPPPKTAHSGLSSSSGLTSPLAQRYARYGIGGSASDLARPMTSDHAPSSGGQSLYDLSSTTRHQMSQAGANHRQPIRAAHHLLGSSSSATNMNDAAASSHLGANDHSRSSSNFSQANATGGGGSTFNIWSRDTSANKVGAGSARGPSSSKASASVRPASSQSSQRPVTARANLLSARDDPIGPSAAHDHANPSTQPHTHHLPSRAPPDVRMHTAAVGSSGAQARARSAHVLSNRPPSRQRPPNQALHLGGTSGTFAPLTGNGRGATAAASVPTRQQPWSLHASGHALNPVVDLFPAAPADLVRAAKSAARARATRTAHAPNGKADADGLTLDHFPLRCASPKGHTTSSSGGTGTGSSDWDTVSDTDTASIETDTDTPASHGVSPEREDGARALDAGVGPLSSDDAGFGFGDSTIASLQSKTFVSLSNILQLQSEASAPRPRSGKSRSGSAAARRNNAATGNL